METCERCDEIKCIESIREEYGGRFGDDIKCYDLDMDMVTNVYTAAWSLKHFRENSEFDKKLGRHQFDYMDPCNCWSRQKLVNLKAQTCECPPPPPPVMKSWVTISPPPSYKISMFKEKITKFIYGSKNIKEGFFGFEFRNEVGECGVHCHIWIDELGAAYKRFGERMRKFFPKCRNYVEKQPIIWRQDKIDYLAGKLFLVNSDKQEKKDRDHDLRKINDMEDIYWIPQA